MAQPTFGAAGSSGVGTTSLSLSYPPGIVAGSLLLMMVANKYPTNGPSTPSGFTLLCQYRSNGGGLAADDSGDVYITVYYRIATGSESGSVTVTITSGNSSQGIISRYEKEGSGSWDIAFCGGEYTGASTSISVTGDTTLDVVAATDRVVVCSAINTNGYSYSGDALSQSGVVYPVGNEYLDSGTGQGNDSHLLIWTAPVTSGSGSAAPTYTVTASGSLVLVNPMCATAIIRLRQVGGPAVGECAGSSGVTAVGAATGEGVGACDGTVSVSGIGTSTAEAVANADGTASVAAVGTGIASAIAEVAGTCSVLAVGTGVYSSVANADGTSDATAQISVLYSLVASAVATSTALGVATAVMPAVASAAGVAIVQIYNGFAYRSYRATIVVRPHLSKATQSE